MAEGPTDGELQAARARFVRLLHLRHLGLDPAVRRYRANEACTANALEHAVGERLERATDRGDWRGTRTRRIYDDCSPAPGKFFDRELGNWRKSLQEHILRYDIVTVDLRNRSLTREQIARVVKTLNALPPTSKQKVLVLLDEDGE